MRKISTTYFGHYKMMEYLTTRYSNFQYTYIIVDRERQDDDGFDLVIYQGDDENEAIEKLRLLAAE